MRTEILVPLLNFIYKKKEKSSSQIMLNCTSFFNTDFLNITVLFWMLILFYFAHRNKIILQKGQNYLSNFFKLK